MLMTMIVTHVATLIHVYSTGYMADEPGLLAVLHVAEPVRSSRCCSW